MSGRAIAVYTPTIIERILQKGGIGPLRLNPRRAHDYGYLVCIRNANDRWAWAVNERGPEEHLSAFLVGRITGLESSLSGGDDRYLVRIREYAKVSVLNVWNAVGTPVKYSTLEEYGIDPSTLAWEPMPAPDSTTGLTSDEPIVAVLPPDLATLTIAEAKELVALTYGVSPDAIMITIQQCSVV